MNKVILNSRYKIIRFVGGGGMGEVYLAHDMLLDRDVAIKMLRNQFMEDGELLEQFRREARSAARLRHSYIINIYDVISDENGQYIVMEYVEGVTFKEFLAENGGKLSVPVVLELGTRLAEALEHAHRHNIIHCDIKPQNILISKDLDPKISDFGISKMISSQTVIYTSSVMGSVHYSPPEQVAGEKVTGSSDVYSLGIVLFEMLTGEVPFTGDTPMAVAMMHKEKPVPPLKNYLDDVPNGLQEIMDKALDKNTGERYLDAGELRRDLENLKARLYHEGTDYKKGLSVTIPVNDTWEGTEWPSAQAEGDPTMILRPGRRQTEEIYFHKKGDAVKLKWKLNFNFIRIGLTRLIIIVTLIVVAISAGAYYHRGRRKLVTVPDVLNTPVADARKVLEDAGFMVDIDEKSSSTAAQGRVINQAPQKGEKRRSGTRVYITVSRGPAVKGLPDVIGCNLDEATKQIEAAGYKVGKVTRKSSDRLKDAVISQSPIAIEKVAEGTPVDLVISDGSIQVPNVLGQSRSYAEQAITGAGLLVGNVTTVKNSAEKDTVIAINPKAGTYLKEKEHVNITVSEGSGNALQANTGGTVSAAGFVDFVLPGTKEQHVQIYINDSRGRRLVYDGTKRGGLRLRQKVDAMGSATVQLYCDNKLVEEKRL
ncbi:MAG: Stk1 family PASTA domain-containing Ser/Thr kinase [Phascolarctobacterium sp.]|nr:Stk1 family PASTA domain-containing Ser/Thr kinase [Phascolarctobacterium sp.]